MSNDDMVSSSTTRGERHWWRKRWWSVLQSIGVAGRVERGKRYARAERVLSLRVEPGRVSADIQGSRFEPYRAEMVLRVFSEDEWRDAVKNLASQALFSAKLLSSEMPENIEEAFSDVGLSLFPGSMDDLEMTCSCPDAVVPCKHLAALHYVLAEKLEEDPFLLFRWRGRPRERILRELRQQRAAEASGRPVEPSSAQSLDELLDRFWEPGGSLGSVKISVGPPPVSASLLKRLGVPAFWHAHPEIRGSLARLYAKVTERAMALAYGGRGIDAVEEEEV